MREYNFDNLSPYDFELLIRDLIQGTEGIKLRSFAPGRDRGIDLRGWETSFLHVLMDRSNASICPVHGGH